MVFRRAPVSTFGRVIELNEKSRAAHPAFVSGGRSITYGAFAARARQLASAFQRTGCHKQDRVAMLSQNSLEQCEFYGACELAGFIAAPLNFRLVGEEIIYQVNDCTAKILIFEDRYTALVEEIRARLPSVLQYVCVGKGPGWAADYESFLSSGDPAGPGFHSQDDDIAFLHYTSGTTGKPKGAMLAHRAHLHTIMACAADVQMNRMDRVAVVMPLFHLGGKVVQLSSQWTGATCHVLERFDEGEYLQTLQDQKITVGHLAPAMIHSLLEHPRVKDFDYGSLRLVLYSAAAMPAAVVRRGMSIFGRVFHQQYGLTEGAGCSLLREEHQPDGDEKAVKRLSSIGLPFSGTEVRIGDENDQPQPQGTPGEILLRTQGTMSGYWNNSVASAETLRNGWLHTGDVGVMDEDGYIYLVDRKKDMIISGGENIYSREVEEVLFQHPDILEAAVIGVADEKWGEAVRALVVVREGRTLTEEQVVEHCRKHLASYKKPRSVIFTGALPRLASGKYDKVTMRRLHGT